MRFHNWTFKVITTYKDGMTSTTHFSNYMDVKLHKMGVLVADGGDETASFKVFPYGGAIA